MTPEEVQDAIIAISQLPVFERDPAIHGLSQRLGRAYRKATLRDMLAETLRAARMVTSEAGTDLLDAKNFLQIATQMLQDEWLHEDGDTLAYWQGCFYKWKGPHWEEFQPKEVESLIYRYMDGRQVDTGEAVIECKPSVTMVNEIIAALTSLVLRKHEKIGEWVGDPLGDNIMAVANGLLDLESGKLFGHTPRYFNLTSCAANWEGEKDVLESRWMSFLHSVITDDRKQIDMLQEAIGYSLTGDTSQQKAFMLVGPRRSGKGTVQRILTDLNGGLVCSMPTSRFGSDFALQNAIGKNVMMLPDVRIDQNTKHAPLTEAILSVTGEDPQSINRKHKAEWNGILACKIWAASNSIPKFKDEDGVLASRFLFVQFNVSHYGREDPKLTAKLKDELSVILWWAVVGWRRMNARGHFMESKTSQGLGEQAIARMDPIGTFVSKYFDLVPESSVKKDHVWLSFFGFAMAHGMNNWTKNGFLKVLAGKDYAGVRPSRVQHYDEHGDPARDGDGNPIRIHILKGLKWKEGMEPTPDRMREMRDDWASTLPASDENIVNMTDPTRNQRGS